MARNASRIKPHVRPPLETRVLVQGSARSQQYACQREAHRAHRVRTIMDECPGTGAWPLTARGQQTSVPKSPHGSPPRHVFRDVENPQTGNVDMRLSGGTAFASTTTAAATVHESANLTPRHAHRGGNVRRRTYASQLTIGTVKAKRGRMRSFSQRQHNATVGLVDAVKNGTGHGYAAFRTANRDADQCPFRRNTGHKVIMRGGGSGMLCVSNGGVSCNIESPTRE